LFAFGVRDGIVVRLWPTRDQGAVFADTRSRATNRFAMLLAVDVVLRHQEPRPSDCHSISAVTFLVSDRLVIAVRQDRVLLLGARLGNSAFGSNLWQIEMVREFDIDAEPPHNLPVGIAGGNGMDTHPPVLTVLLP